MMLRGALHCGNTADGKPAPAADLVALEPLLNLLLLLEMLLCRQCLDGALDAAVLLQLGLLPTLLLQALLLEVLHCRQIHDSLLAASPQLVMMTTLRLSLRRLDAPQ